MYNGGMATEPENLTLKQLALLRSEMQEGFAKITAEQVLAARKIGAMAEGMVSVTKRLDDLDHKVDDLTKSNRLVALAVDDHTHRLDKIDDRLDRIEKKIGLVKA
jgi:tetrahydromethanopterin S-methyltransferase subunit G